MAAALERRKKAESPTVPKNGRTTSKRQWQGSTDFGLPYPRLMLLLGLFALGFVALAGRLSYLQVARHKEFVRAAEKMRNRDIPLPAVRGELLDRNGNLLVRNEPAYNVVLDPNIWFVHTNAKSGDTSEVRQKAALDALKICLPAVDVAQILKEKPLKANKTGRYRPLDLLHRASVESVQKLITAKTGCTEAEQHQNPKGCATRKENIAALSSVGLLSTTRRVAVNGDLAPHLLGFTGKEGEGREGLEFGLQSKLAGKSGLLSGEFDFKRRMIPGTVKQTAAQGGRDIVLTIDSEVQSVVQNALAKLAADCEPESASAIVLEPKTGDILAVANIPTYNTNQRESVKPDALKNRALTTPFEPGSTLKIITAVAGLESHKVTLNTHFQCTGTLQVGKHTVHCAHGEVHGDVDLANMIKKSCNVATAQAGHVIGAPTLYKYERLFGFGQKSGTGLPGENTGHLPPLNKWSPVSLATISFGQGISVTALQLASAYATLANDGVPIRPRIVWGTRGQGEATITPEPTVTGRPIVTLETARAARRLLLGVIEGGTGNKAQIDGYTAGGKTGTAQMAENGRYLDGKYVASFVGMAPIDSPEIVVLVSVTAPRKGHYGGDVAAPVFREIAQQTLLLRRTPRDRVKLDVRQLPAVGEAALHGERAYKPQVYKKPAFRMPLAKPSKTVAPQNDAEPIIPKKSSEKSTMPHDHADEQPGLRARRIHLHKRNGGSGDVAVVREYPV